jgi:hypothetical protein
MINAQLAQIAKGFAYHYQKSRNEQATGNGRYGAHVQGQLQEFKQVSYRQKVFQAIQDSSLSSKKVIIRAPINRLIQLLVVIDKKGRLVKSVFSKTTGDAIVDNHIMHIVRTAQYPPIPPKLEQEQYTLTLQASVNVPAGEAVMRFHYR